jgi:parvulin-like peptidyl-prolyl isomerase
MKILRLLLVAGLSIATTVIAAVRPNGIAAIVNDALITVGDVERHAEASFELIRRTYYSQPDVLEAKWGETVGRSLEDLIERKLILDDFKAQGGALPDSIIEDEIKDRIRQKYGDRATLTRTLKAIGKTYETYRQELREEIIVGYLRSKNISQAVLISPTKIERFYATNFTRFKLDEQVHLRVIVLNASPETVNEVRQRLQEILEKIKQGAPFAEMASIYSEGSTRQQQGDWGWVEKSKKSGISSVGFDLKAGEHSGVTGLGRVGDEGYWIYQYDETGRLTTGRRHTSRDEVTEEKKFEPGAAPPVSPQEFYLIKVEERRPPRTSSLEEVRDGIEKDLIAMERARLQQRWVDRLRKKAFVRYYTGF